jgi:hypothetical protein
VGWVYIDDHFDEHPKVIEARDFHKDAPWLFVAALCYCRRSNTNGYVMASQVPRLITGYTPKARKALVAVGLWDENVNGIDIHDYLEWNRASEAKSASARNAAQVRWQNERDAKRNA